MAERQSDDNLDKSIEEYLRDPGQFEPGPPDPYDNTPAPQSRFSRTAQLSTLQASKYILQVSGNIDRAREYALNFARDFKATDEEANELLQSAGLSTLGPKERLAALKQAAREFADNKSGADEMEKALQMYPPTPQAVMQMMQARISELSLPPGQNIPNSRQEEQKTPPWYFFRKLLGGRRS